MIVSYTGMAEKTKMSVTSVTLHDGRTRIKIAKQGFTLFFPYSEVTQDVQVIQNSREHGLTTQTQGTGQSLEAFSRCKGMERVDEKYPHFAADSQNVILGLASDGFNPFCVMSTTHSAWLVLLIPYNLPLWLCMKQPSIILSMIIAGERAPGMDIDVYLQPLIKALLQLWEGVDVFDAYTMTQFKLKRTVYSITNDFPAYANFSGWSTKGRFTCPTCAEGTQSMWLENRHKFCYMGHRRWLPINDPFRYDAVGFDMSVKYDSAPKPVSRSAILADLEGTTFIYDKGGNQTAEVDEKDEQQI